VGSFFGQPIVLSDGKQVRLVSKFNNDELTTLYIELKDIYQGEWRYYGSATDRDGKEMNFQKVDSKVGSCVQGCNLVEKVRISINLDYLKSMRNRGIDIQVYGQRGGSKIILSQQYVEGFLSYLNQ
jgi:hypothetical protein